MFLAIMLVIGLAGVMVAWGSTVNTGAQDRLGPPHHPHRAA